MKQRSSFRLASYNIRKCVGLDRRRNPERVLSVINGLGADVVVLQEADRRLGDRPAALPARLIEQETDFHAVMAGNAPSVGWHGNAILVRKGVAVTEVETLDLPGTEPRGAISVTLAGSLRVVGTHLGLLRSDRRAQSHAISQFLGATALPSVIAGDFNEWSHKRGLEALDQSHEIHRPGKSFHAARPVASLDRIALSPAMELADAGVVETELSRIASDHLPIWADITLSPGLALDAN